MPVDIVNRIVPQLVRGEKLKKPGLGIRWVPEYAVSRLGLEGVLILEVTPGSPADKAGLRPTKEDSFGHLILGDLIVAADGKPVRNVNDLFRVLDAHEVGDTIRFTMVRNNRPADVDIQLQALP
ncbi:MAG: PDZ domain-containing protein [Planctomycetes bacterium]|nr:PDZ domain-containing protein [Planctomycetota bacterium]